MAGGQKDLSFFLPNIDPNLQFLLGARIIEKFEI